MLSNRREFLKYINEGFRREPSYGENYTPELHQQVLEKLKKNLPTCPIVLMNSKDYEVVMARILSTECETTQTGEEQSRVVGFRQEVEAQHQAQKERLAEFVNGLKETITDDVDTITAAYEMTIKRADAAHKETLHILDEVLNNPLEYESKGMPFEMLMLITTGNSEESGLLGALFLEINPEQWITMSVNKHRARTLLTTQTQVSVEGGVTTAEAAEIKAIDYLLNQRNNIVELETTSLGLGQHVKLVSRGTRQNPEHIIYIGNKKRFLKEFPTQVARIMRKPVFAHMVRGHWRRLQEHQHQGKDRHGKVIFNGYTWVIAHKRGKGEITSSPIYAVNTNNLH